MEAYSKEALGKEIRRLTATNIQLMNDNLNTEVAKTKLEADKAKLIYEKNILMVKKEELQAELVEAVTVPTTSIQVSVTIVYDKFKAKRLLLFDRIKEMF